MSFGWDSLSPWGRRQARRYYRHLREYGQPRSTARMVTIAVLDGVGFAQYWTEQTEES